MAHLWVEQDPGEWNILPLGSERLLLTGDRERPVGGADWQGPLCGALHPVAGAGAEWVLLCRPGACRVNGEPVALGIQALSDRDEIIAIQGVRLFFSTETLARIVPFPGAEPAAFCPRCLQEVAAGSPAVQCPRCGVAYHEDPETGLTCWTYGPCAFCGQPGALDEGFRWTPEEL